MHYPKSRLQTQNLTTVTNILIYTNNDNIVTNEENRLLTVIYITSLNWSHNGSKNYTVDSMS